MGSYMWVKKFFLNTNEMVVSRRQGLENMLVIFE